MAKTRNRRPSVKISLTKSRLQCSLGRDGNAILASIGEARVARRTVARVCIDHGQDAQFLAGRELVVHEVHDSVRQDGVISGVAPGCHDQAALGVI